MEAKQDSVVSIYYVLRDTDGEIIDQSSEGQPLAYLHGHGNIVPGLEKAIEGHAQGDEVKATVEPEEGYGPYREELVQKVSRDAFQGVDELAPGMSFRAESDAGPMIVTVKEVEGEEVTVDGNHVLAGQTLNFTVNIHDVREASSEEIEHGHVHDGSTHG
ncbi:FKBP-type peptidylprolyl isomerase [Salinisphaera sp. T5B8]|uniref:peptidylprolyl isomerase n=1 Tax=Salinisphaera sp. T5B8 TaxID=1304154 RepID=UPI003340EA92